MRKLVKGFVRPQGITFEYTEHNDTYGKFTAMPLECGYGTTLGNSLRRILLASIHGYAISSIRITFYDKDETSHLISSEFENIPHVVEDTLDIISNLKKLSLKFNDETPSRVISLSIKGAQKVTGASFEDAQVEVLNKDHHIMTTMEEAHIELEAQIDFSRGYVPAESMRDAIETFGTIPIDAIFSPITRVNFNVENVRISHRTDYDKLEMQIWTDGTITPENALAEAARIAKEHFMVFINSDSNDNLFTQEEDENDERVRTLMAMSLAELDLTPRSSNCLEHEGIKTVGDLIARDEEDVTKIRNFGKKSLSEIKSRLKEWSLRLGMRDKQEIKAAILSSEQKTGQ